MRAGVDLSSLTPDWMRPDRLPPAPKIGRPLGRTVELVEIEAAVREVYADVGNPDKLPPLETVAELLKVSPKTISRVVRGAGWSDYRRWTRQLGLT